MTLCGAALALAAAGSVGCDVAAGSEDRTFASASGTATATHDYVAFGDSIVAGYCGWYCRLDSYAAQFAQGIADQANVTVTYHGRGLSGALMQEIADEIVNDGTEIAAADTITVEGCGNDFLTARDTYQAQADCTDGRVMVAAAVACRTQMARALDAIAAHKRADATVVVMNLYYPTVAKDLTHTCAGHTDFDLFLPVLTQSNWTTCDLAWQHGFRCVDSLAVMNAADVDRDHDNVIDADEIRLDPIVDDNDFPGYHGRILNDAHVFSDAHQKVLVGGIPSDYLQEDDTHPSSAGATRLAREHLAQRFCGTGKDCALGQSRLRTQ